ncbi:hypothetical protein GOODEAATRI_027351 [Goodea atripinnis]|uniref:Secreted protein n=1 Tax=Goodea atripinnis TaxID=208336 RepID=A0ABV0PS26_9TELE
MIRSALYCVLFTTIFIAIRAKGGPKPLMIGSYRLSYYRNYLKVIPFNETGCSLPAIVLGVSRARYAAGGPFQREALLMEAAAEAGMLRFCQRAVAAAALRILLTDPLLQFPASLFPSICAYHVTD